MSFKDVPFYICPRHLKAACGFLWLSPQVRYLLHLVFVEDAPGRQSCKARDVEGLPHFFSVAWLLFSGCHHPVTPLSPEAFFVVRWILVHLRVMMVYLGRGE